jgi:hypothetical protein
MGITNLTANSRNPRENRYKSPVLPINLSTVIQYSSANPKDEAALMAEAIHKITDNFFISLVPRLSKIAFIVDNDSFLPL